MFRYALMPCTARVKLSLESKATAFDMSSHYIVTSTAWCPATQHYTNYVVTGTRIFIFITRPTGSHFGMTCDDFDSGKRLGGWEFTESMLSNTG